MKDKAELFSAYWRMLAPTGAPQPIPEKTGCVPGRKFRVDWCFEAARVVVEVDGGTHAYGGGRHATDKDREKTNLLTLNGWLCLRYSPDMIEADPMTVINQVLQLVFPSTQKSASASKGANHVSHSRRRNPVAKSPAQHKPVGNRHGSGSRRGAAGRPVGTKTGRANQAVFSLSKGQGGDNSIP